MACVYVISNVETAINSDWGSALLNTNTTYVKYSGVLRLTGVMVNGKYYLGWLFNTVFMFRYTH